MSVSPFESLVELWAPQPAEQQAELFAELVEGPVVVPGNRAASPVEELREPPFPSSIHSFVPSDLNLYYGAV
jgi:hypothetical protein